MPWAPGRRRVRRPGRRQRALRGLLVPAHRPDAHQAQQPHRRGAPALPAAGVRRRRAAGQHAPSALVNRVGDLAPRAGPPAQPAVLPGALAAGLQRRLPPGAHLAAAGGVPGDGVRRAARGRHAGAHRGPGARRAARLAHRLPGRDPARARPTTPGSRPPTGGTRSTSPSTSTPAPTTPTTSPGSSRCCGPTTGGRTGASSTPAARPTWRRRTRGSRTSSRVRDRVDPDRLFTNPYLERVLTR